MVSVCLSIIPKEVETATQETTMNETKIALMVSVCLLIIPTEMLIELNGISHVLQTGSRVYFAILVDNKDISIEDPVSLVI